MKPVFIVVAYLAGTVLLGAALAPLLFWAVHQLEPWALANGLLRFDPYASEVRVEGAFAFLEAGFQKIFHRAILLSALVLLWPTVRALRIRSLADLRLRRDPRRWGHLGFGSLVGGGVVGLMAAGYIFTKYYHFKAPLPFSALPQIFVSSVVVGVLEECLFRGAILGLFLRSMKPYPALAWTTFLFAILHFLRPGEETASVEAGHWFSGFALLPDLFHLFGEPLMLAAGLSTLLVLGWLLGYVRLRTGSLWMSIGLHASIVFVKMGFSKLTKRDELSLPWVGPELQIGLVPVVLLLIGLYLCHRRLEYEELLPNPRPRA